MAIVTNVYRTFIGDREYVQSARLRDEDTGQEYLLDRDELIDPDDIEVGEDEAYKVSFASNVIDKTYGTYQLKLKED